MLFLLSSRDFEHSVSKEKILSHLSKPLPEQRVLFLPNEKFTPEKLARGKYHNRLAGHGFDPSLVTVLNYDDPDPEHYRAMTFDMVYASGGNTFLTLERICRGGFSEMICDHVRCGAVYVGGSAGAHMACQDIAHVAKYDELPPGMSLPHGLFDLPLILLCHYTPAREAHRRALEATGVSVCAMTDEDVLVYATEEDRRTARKR